MKINLTDREWRHVQIGLLQSISQADKSCKKIKFEDNSLIKELLKLHDIHIKHAEQYNKQVLGSD